MVEPDVFLRAKKVIENRRVDLPEEEMLARLRRTLMKEGRLSPAIIDRTVGLPCTQTFMQHFGSLRNVYRLIGYASKRNCDYIDSRQTWAELTAKLASQVATAIEKAGGRVARHGSADCLRVNAKVGILIRVARWSPGKLKSHSAHWAIQCRDQLPAAWIVAIRLGEDNTAVLDYLLLPTDGQVGRLIRFSEKARARRAIDRYATPDALVRSISLRATTATPCLWNQVSTAEQAIEIAPAQKKEPRRAALIERR
jgi:hypothetical protein